MKRIAIIFILFSVVVGCASPTAVPVKFAVTDDQKYVPINLNITSDKIDAYYNSTAMDYIYESLNRSNLFSRIKTSNDEYQYTLNINYSWDSPLTVGTLAGAMITASTLLLIPSNNQELHSINVEILNGDELVYASTYCGIITTTFSMYHNITEDRKNGINKILIKLYKDIESKKIFPRNYELGSTIGAK